MAEEEVGLRLSLKDRRETAAGLDDVERRVDDVGDAAARSGRQATIASRGFAAMGRAGRAAGALIKWGFAGALAAGYGATRLLRASFAEAREAQKIGATTRQIIKSTGGVARVSYRHVDRYVGRLSELIGVDDELIQQSGNLLLTFKNVRNETGRGNKVWDQALSLATDLSAAGFGSMESAAKMLGKALNDPVKGITAMSRAGVTFTEGQIDRIKNLVEENKLLEAQKIILGEVQSQVGGVAREQATFGDRATVVWGNLQERLGTALLPMLDRFQGWFVREGGPALDRYIGIFEDKGIPAIERFVDRAQPIVADVLPAVVDATRAVARFASKAAPKVADLVQGFADMPEWAQTLLIGGAAAGVVGSKFGLGKLLGGGAKGLGGLISKASPVPVVIVKDLSGRDLPGGGKPGGGGKFPWLAGGAYGLFALGAGLSEKAGVSLADRHDAAGPQSGSHVGGGSGFGFGSALLDHANAADHAADRVQHLWDLWQDGTTQYRRQLQGTELELGGFFDLFTAGTDDTQRRLDRLGDTRVRPEFGTPGLPEANRNTDALANLLGIVSRGARAHVDVDTSSANARLDTLMSRLSNFSNNTYSAFVGVFGGGTPRATGGPVTAGRPYVVGERRPELFVPRTNGYVLPKVPDPVDVARALGDEAVDLRVSGGGAGEPTVIKLYLNDGRQVATWLLDELGTEAAAR